MIIKRDFIYTPKGKNRPLHIYLPDDYFDTEERYPVTYFFDGHNLFRDEDATYGKCWGLKTFLDGWSKKMIVVGMECGHDGDERLSEYLPYPANRGTYFAGFVPKGDETLQWILSEVKPLIDLEYRTIPFRECTGIAGSSMGGLMALYAVVHYNRWFSKGGCVSSAIGFCMRPLMSDMRKNKLSPPVPVLGHPGSLRHQGPGKRRPQQQDLRLEQKGGRPRQNQRRGSKAPLPGRRQTLRSRLGKAGSRIHGLSVDGMI